MVFPSELGVGLAFALMNGANACKWGWQAPYRMPEFWGTDMLIAERDGRGVLVLNDSQHQYIWVKQ
jgi:hypothetical protein